MTLEGSSFASEAPSWADGRTPVATRDDFGLKWVPGALALITRLLDICSLSRYFSETDRQEFYAKQWVL